MTINFDDFKVRCSAIQKVLSNSQDNPVLTEKQAIELVDLEEKLQKNGSITQKQQERLAELKVKQENGKKIILSDTCISYLMEVYAWEVYGMIPVGKESMDLLGMRKGKKVETESVALLSEVDGIEYKIHKDRIFNEYLSGEIDVYAGEHVYAAVNVSDMKNATDYPTFLKKIHTGLENGQKEQIQGYGDITGARDLYIVNSLVDCPEEDIIEMQWRVAKKMGAATTESTEFLEEWPKWERSMRFGRIPKHQRISKIKVDPFSDHKRQFLYDRVKICRDWLNNFHEQYQKLNLVGSLINNM